MATAKKTTKKTTTRKPATTKTGAASANGTAGGRTSTPRPFELRSVDVRGVVTGGAYATVGAGDLAVEVARELPQRVEALRKQRVELAKAGRTRAESFVKEAPVFVKEAPTKLRTELDESIETARKELDTYAQRGRKVVDSIAKAPTTKRALSQTETARSQVKGAVTSIRRVVEQGQEAVEGAVGRIGRRRSA